MSEARRSILVPCSTPLSYAVVAPILRGLVAGGDVDVYVAARHGGTRVAAECLDVPFHYRHPVLARFVRYDVALCPGFYFGGRCATKVQVFHGVSPKNYAVSRDVADFEHLFLIGEYHRLKFGRAGFLAPGDARGYAIGMPKTDPLATPLPAAERERRHAVLDLDPSRPLVAYAPTRSGGAGSSMDEQGLAVIESLARLPVNVVVKLHDRSRRRFRRKLENDYEAAIAALAHGGRVRLWEGHDVIPLLALADVLVSDLSSVTHEFLLRDKPIVYLATESHDRKIVRTAARKFGADDPHDLPWLRRAGEVAADPTAAAAAVERALADPAARSAERRERAALLFYNPGRATAAAVAAVRRILELEDREPRGSEELDLR
jgi:hypothetical protein